MSRICAVNTFCETLPTDRARHGLASTFCCISMGVFMFHNARAAEIAVQAVRSFKADTGCSIEVIFNVFKQQDELIYRQLLS